MTTDNPITNDEQKFLLAALSGEQKIIVDRELLAGRDPLSDIVLDQGLASRQHAKFRPAADGVIVEDLNSTNGTFVNEQKITASTLLQAGDEVRIGPARFELRQQSLATIDPDATMLYSPDSTLKDKNEALEKKPLANTQPQGAVAAKEEAAADSKAPPSWVLNNQQSVDGTKFISKDILHDVMAQSAASAKFNEAVQEPTLIGGSDPIMAMRFQLLGEGKNQWEIGRATSSDVMINHESVSSSHAQIIRDGSRWKLVDLMSANGSYVNGKKCLSGYLSSGDALRFGNVECSFMLPAGSAPPNAADVQQSEAKSSTAKTAAIAFAVTAALAGAALFAISRFL